MDSSNNCRSQATECLRLMKLTSSQAEAKLLNDIAQSWVRLANQIDRYRELVRNSGRPNVVSLEVGPD